MSQVRNKLRAIVIGCTILALVGGVSCVALASGHWEVLCRPLLLGYLCCWLVTMGAAGLLAIGNLTGGNWAAAARPFYLAAMKTWPLLLLMYVLMAMNLNQIYPWASATSGVHEPLSAAKAEYLSPNFFLARAVSYHVLWLLVWLLLVAASRIDLPPGNTPAMRRAGAISLVLLAPTTTFAAFDWAMSLEPHWYSSIYGAILTAGGVVAAMALAIVGLTISASGNMHIQLPASDGATEAVAIGDVLNDLGNLLLAFVMVWTYFSFSQFLIIWSGNLPHEIAWYERRLTAGWSAIALVVVVFCFAIPFLMLLSRDGKRNSKYLRSVAMFVLSAYAINLVWTIVPAFEPVTARSCAVSACALLSIGSVWLAFYFHHVNRANRVVSTPIR